MGVFATTVTVGGYETDANGDVNLALGDPVRGPQLLGAAPVPAPEK